MAAFKELIGQHIDVQAIVYNAGLASIEEQRHKLCRTWLSRNGYSLDTLDCHNPINQVRADLHRLLKWEEQFGYIPDPERGNLDALSDGFTFDIPEGGGHVLELVRVDLAWQQDPNWVLGLLSIAQNYSRWELALGRRFFILLVVAEKSAMMGVRIDENRVPGLFYGFNPAYHQFER